MLKHFYSYIVETDTLFMEIDSLEISTGEKEHLKSLAESNIHHSIIDTVLSELNPEDKKAFLEHMESKNADRIWKFLNARVVNIEEKIKQAAHEVKKELHKDLKEAKESK